MNKFNFNKLTPFKWFVLENFPFIEADFDALTEWQLFCKLGKEMNKIINSENALGTQMENVTNAFIDLQNYINNYFKNLDLQDEINNKLNEMAQDGTLADIINKEILNKKISSYNTLNDLINDESIQKDNIVLVFGKNNLNDGEGAIYEISENKKTNSITLKNNLYANVINSFMNNFYDEITYKKIRKNGTDFYLTTIPKVDKFGNLIETVVESDDESPLLHAQKNYTSFTCNGALSLGGDVGGGTYADTLVISNGEIISPYNDRTKELSDLYQFLCIDANRNITSVQANTANPQEMIANGVKQAFLVWYQCIENGVVKNPNNHISNAKNDIRQILGVTANGTILLLTNDGRSLSSIGTNLQNACNILIENGAISAWELDGGGSASTIINTIKINRNHDEWKTKDRNIKYTLNAKKVILNKEVAQSYVETSKAKQDLNYQLRNQMHKYFSLLINNVNNIPGNEQYGILEVSQNSPTFPFINFNNNKISFNTKGDYLISGYVEIELLENTEQKRSYFELFKNNEKIDNNSGTTAFENIINNKIILHIPFSKAITVNNVDDVFYYQHYFSTEISILRGELEIIPLEYY